MSSANIWMFALMSETMSSIDIKKRRGPKIDYKTEEQSMMWDTVKSMRMASRSDKSVFPWDRKNRRGQDCPKMSDRTVDSSNLVISSILEVVIVMWFKTGLILFTSFCRVWAPNYSSRGLWSQQMLFRRFALVISSSTVFSPILLWSKDDLDLEEIKDLRQIHHDFHDDGEERSFCANIL